MNTKVTPLNSEVAYSSMKTRMPRKSKIFGMIGLGVATASILWVLVNLITFYFFGSVIIGENNRSLLFGEISLVTFGLVCFLADLRVRRSLEQ